MESEPGAFVTPAAEGYAAAVAAAERQIAGAPAEARIRLAKRTSNLFRPREQHTGVWLDAAPFTQVLDVDAAARTASVGGMTTYEDLVSATLAHGMMPLVVPQLRTITLGGAVTGLGIEATSFRSGLPHESVLEMDVLTGSGEVVTARPDNEHSDLFRAFPNSYGTFGYALRLEIELEPVRPYVHLRHVRFGDVAELAAAIATVCADREYAGERVDFVDGVWFSGAEQYLTLGSYADSAPYTSDYTGQRIFYRSLQYRAEDYLTIEDYLWRWDTDWFWCSRAFGAQHPLVRRVWPRSKRRSDVYWRLIALDRRYAVAARLDRWRGRPPRENVVQDVEVPVDRLPEMLEGLHEITGIEPVWVCPVAVRDPAGWPLYPMKPGELYVNVGFWSSTALEPGEVDGDVNRRVERLVDDLGGHKSLYSTSYYPAEEFWERYPAEEYWPVKKRYDPAGRLADLYTKCVTRA